jgi:hypothetical protein
MSHAEFREVQWGSQRRLHGCLAASPKCRGDQVRRSGLGGDHHTPGNMR